LVNPLLELAALLVGIEQPLRDERDVLRILALDALPRLDRRFWLLRRDLEVAEQHVRAHAQAVVGERLRQMRARRLGA
jgi:hypothetical protein